MSRRERGRIRFGGPDVRAETEEEIRFHLESAERDLVAAGLDPAEARREARRRFGDPERWRTVCLTAETQRRRRRERARFLDGIRLDLVAAARQLRRRPGFALGSIAILGLGIGLATAIFALVDAVLLRPLPYPEPDRLVALHAANPEQGWVSAGLSGPEVVAARDRSRTLTGVAAYHRSEANATLGDRAFRLETVESWGALFPTLGVAPHLGSFYVTGGDGPRRTVVLSHDFWSARLGADPAIVGDTLRLDGHDLEIVGVAPAGFRFPAPGIDVYRPLSEDPEYLGEAHWLSAVARLAPAAGGSRPIGLDGARAEVEALFVHLDEARPEAEGWRGRVASLHEWTVGGAARGLFLLQAAVALLLLVACSNVAHLLLARQTDRRRELATRAALGAGSPRLIRLALVEVLVLAGGGVVAGLLLARTIVAAVPRWVGSTLPRLDGLALDGSVVAVAVAAGVSTCLVFGLLPARAASRLGTRATTLALRGARGARAESSTARPVLIVLQVALATVLVVVAGLVGRSLAELSGVDPGFRTEALTFRIAPPMESLTAEDPLAAVPAERERIADRFLRLRDRLAALPGVAAVGAINELPLAGGRWFEGVEVVGRDPEPRTSRHRVVGPGYFEAAGIPVLAGRTLGDDEAERVTVVSETAARQWWGSSTTALGREIRLEDPDGRPLRVVGVVADVLTDALHRAPEPTVYVPLRQAWSGFPGTWSLAFVVRTPGGARAEAIEAIREVVAELEPELPIFGISTLGDRRRDQLVDERLRAASIGTFAVSALVLAAVGLAGVVAAAVRRGRLGIGIRLALGARPRDVVALELRRALALAGVGLAGGLLGAAAVCRWLDAELYGLGPRDPSTWLGAVAALALTVLFAAWIPARRAGGTDPATVLRND